MRRRIALVVPILLLGIFGFISSSLFYKSNVESSSTATKGTITVRKAAKTQLSAQENIFALTLKSNGEIFSVQEPKPDIVKFGFNADGTLQPLDRFEGARQALNNITFADSQIGFCVGHFGTILKTQDGGKTWTLLPPFSEFDLTQVEFLNSSLGYVTGKSVIPGSETGDDESESCGIEHDFQRHQHEDEVATNENADRPEREQHGRHR